MTVTQSLVRLPIEGQDKRITVDRTGGVLHCVCGATAHNTPTERNRFLRRHPSMCQERRAFAKQLAQGTRHLDDLETNQ